MGDCREGNDVSIWSSLALANEVATAGSGAANAAYFAHRASRARGARRGAALLLTLLFAATALDSVAYLLIAEPTPEGALLRVPLLVANVAVGLAIVAGAGRSSGR